MEFELGKLFEEKDEKLFYKGNNDFNRVKRFNKYFEDLNNIILEREDIIKQLKFAFLTREHLLLEGDSGTGKSFLADTVFNNISGKKECFSFQFSQFVSEDYIIGPVNPKVLREKGIIQHNIDKTIVTADFAFLDEFFDASDALLRGTLLGILNERKFKRGNQLLDCPLHTAIATTNFDRRSDNATDAVYKRFIFRSKVKAIESMENRLKMYNNSLNYNSQFDVLIDVNLSFSDIKLLSDVIIKSDVIKLSFPILKCFDMIIDDFLKETKSKKICDREKNAYLKILKSSALLSNRKSVSIKDFDSLSTVLCEKMDDFIILTKCISKIKSNLKNLIEAEESIGVLEYQFNRIKNDKKISNSKRIFELEGLVVRIEEYELDNESSYGKKGIIDRLFALKSEIDGVKTSSMDFLEEDDDLNVDEED